MQHSVHMNRNNSPLSLRGVSRPKGGTGCVIKGVVDTPQLNYDVFS